jgi:hypothetical protein
MERQKSSINRIVKNFNNTKPFEKVCEKDNKIKQFEIKNRLGGESLYGEVYKICTGSQCYALKKTPFVYPEDFYIFEHEIQQDFIKNEVPAETWMLIMSNKILEQKISPNFPATFSFYMCEDCSFQDPEKNHLPCLLSSSQLANGDLEKYLQIPRTGTEWFSMLFQVYSALYVLKTKLNAIHFDMHWGNVLYYNIPEKNGYFKYTIQGVNYYVPNTSVVFILWDFGQVRIPGKIELQDFSHHQEKSFGNLWAVDYEKITNCIKWTQEDGVEVPQGLNEVRTVIKNFASEGKDVSEVISQIFGPFTNVPPKSSKIISEYNLDKKFIPGTLNIGKTRPKSERFKNPKKTSDSKKTIKKSEPKKSLRGF